MLIVGTHVSSKDSTGQIYGVIGEVTTDHQGSTIYRIDWLEGGYDYCYDFEFEVITHSHVYGKANGIGCLAVVEWTTKELPVMNINVCCAEALRLIAEARPTINSMSDSTNQRRMTRRCNRIKEYLESDCIDFLPLETSALREIVRRVKDDNAVNAILGIVCYIERAFSNY